jgi:type VI secretion system protein ImpL
MKIKALISKLVKSRAFWWFWVVVLVDVLIWFVGPAIGFYGVTPLSNLWLQVLLMILVFLIWVVLHFKRRIKQHLQGTKIFHDEAVASPPLSGHIHRRLSRVLKKDFRRLKHFLHGREVHRYWFFKRHNLYDIPWYLVLGAEGSGKTSFVRQARLHFIAQSYSHFEVQSEAFHYALAQEALLFDVSHALFSQKTLKERHLWLTLIKCIKRARVRRPLNGIVLAISILDLVHAKPEVRQKLFEDMRLRLHDVQQRMGMSIPVYVVVTHLDVLDGFTDFVLRFTDQERQALLGITFSVNSEAPMDQFPFEYDLLLQHIHERLRRDLDGEYSAETHSRMAYFAVQMAALKVQILEFAKEIFLARRILHKNDWRGIYFVAHHLQGDQRFDVVTRERSLSMQEIPRFLKDKAFFVANIMQEALLPEQEYVSVHRLFMRHWGLFGQGRTLVFVGLSLVIMVLWLFSVNQYLDYNAEISWRLDHPIVPVNMTQDDALNSFYPRLDLLGNLYHEADTRMFLHMGLWVHHSAHSALVVLYQEALMQQFLPYVLTVLSTNLNAAVMQSSHGENMTNVENLYFYLSSYLMFSSLSKMDTQQVNNVLNASWSNAFTNNLTLQNWLSVRLEDLLNAPLQAQNLNSSLIKQARVALWSSPIYMQAYLRLKLNTLQANPKTINVAGLLNADASEVFSNLNHAAVSIFYTHEGYHDIYLAEAQHYLENTADESWVFGSDYQAHYSSSDLDNFREQMDMLYWQDYLDAWNNALSQINLVSFADLQTELSVLTVLTAKNSPFNHLLNSIKQNTSFDHPALRQDSSNIVTNQFAPLTALVLASGDQLAPMQNIQSNFVALQQYLSGLANSSNPGLSSYNAAVQIFQGQADHSITALQTLAVQMPQPMSRWLNQVVVNTYAAIFAEANAYLSTQWQANVASFYQQALAGRYPFVKNNNDATVQDFANFFKPGGVEDSFVKKYLAPFTMTDSFGHVSWASVNNVGLSNNLAVLNEIEQANQIRNTFFGSSNGALNFTLAPQSLDGLHKFMLNYDGRSVTNNGDVLAGTAFVWPPTNTDGTVSVTYARVLSSDVIENYPGSWGLFKLLEQSNLLKAKYGSSYTLVFRDQGMSATFILSASSVNNPFDLRMLRNYHCPDKF